MFILTIKDIRRYITSFHSGKVISKYNICKAANKGFLTILKYNYKMKKGDLDWNLAVNCTIAKNQLECLIWLCENTIVFCDYTHLRWAYRTGHLRIVKYLYENRGIRDGMKIYPCYGFYNSSIVNYIQDHIIPSK